MPNSELMPAVILAGGLATRLRPLTDTIPKALIDIGGRPFLAHQLELLRRNGISEAVLLAGHLGEEIRRRFGDGSAGMKLQYSFDGPVLRGTAGAVRGALALLPERFFLMYGDSYLPCDYASIQAAFEACGKQALMTVFHNNDLYDQSNVEFDGKRILRYDKTVKTPGMTYIDYGLGAFDRSVIAALPPDHRGDLAALYQRLLTLGELAAWEVHERFYEIGSPEGLEDTRRYILAGSRPQA